MRKAKEHIPQSEQTVGIVRVWIKRRRKNNFYDIHIWENNVSGNNETTSIELWGARDSMFRTVSDAINSYLNLFRFGPPTCPSILQKPRLDLAVLSCPRAVLLKIWPFVSVRRISKHKQLISFGSADRSDTSEEHVYLSGQQKRPNVLPAAVVGGPNELQPVTNLDSPVQISGVPGDADLRTEQWRPVCSDGRDVSDDKRSVNRLGRFQKRRSATPVRSVGDRDRFINYATSKDNLAIKRIRNPRSLGARPLSVSPRPLVHVQT